MMRTLKLGLGLAILFCGSQALAGKLPNVVFLFADDLGYGDLGCY